MRRGASLFGNRADRDLRRRVPGVREGMARREIPGRAEGDPGEQDELKEREMRIKTCLVIFFALSLFSLAADTVLFESILKDAVFIPLYISMHPTEKSVPAAGWWTLKFENGAVISVYREPAKPLPKDDVWWIGKVYEVSKKGFGENYLIVKLKQEPK